MCRVRNVVLSAALLTSTALVLTLQAFAAGAGGSPEDAARFIEQNIGLTSRPVTLDQLRRRVRPKSESSRDVRNAHIPGQIDKMTVLAGDGIEVEAYVPATGPVLVQRIKVTATDSKLPLGLWIGRSALDDMYGALGENAENAKGPGGEFARRYLNPERTASALLWFGHDERLAGVEWRFGGD
jgi:hypothetical protein